MRKTFLPVCASSIEEEEINEVVSTLRSGWITTGPKVRQFETNFAQYKEVPSALALSSCTAALHLALIGAGVGENDEVITTAMTFCATVNSIIYTGATPVLVDINEKTNNIDPERIKEKINLRTKAVVVVHLAGRMCDMSTIKKICNEHQLVLIEDSAHAIESKYYQQDAGTLGDFGCFSLYATKNMTTIEGGVLISKDEEVLHRLRQISLHGMDNQAWQRFQQFHVKPYLVSQLGFKYNMTDVQASIGLHQIKRIEKNWSKRKAIWDYYNQSLHNLPICLPAEIGTHEKHGLHLYSIRITTETGMSRDAFCQQMYQHNIGTSIHYTSIPEHPYYQKRFIWKPQDYPHAYLFSQENVSLPLYPQLSHEDTRSVVDTVHTILRHN